MGQLASERLAVALHDDDAARTPSQLRWPSQKMGRPTVDLEDKHALWSALEEEMHSPA